MERTAPDIRYILYIYIYMYRTSAVRPQRGIVVTRNHSRLQNEIPSHVTARPQNEIPSNETQHPHNVMSKGFIIIRPADTSSVYRIPGHREPTIVLLLKFGEYSGVQVFVRQKA
jgi:hypothetical protein